MPFKSLKQEKYLYSQHPEIAAKFQEDTPKAPKPNLLDSIAKKRKVGSTNSQFSSSQAKDFSPGESGTNTSGVY